MTKMNSQRRSLAVALDMVEAAIDSLEKQAKQSKLFQEQQQQASEKVQPSLHQQDQKLVEERLSPIPDKPVQSSNIKVSRESDEENISDDKSSRKHLNGAINYGSISLHSKEHSSIKEECENIDTKTILKPKSQPPGVLLHHRSSTPRKKSRKRSSSGGKHHHKSSHKREKNNNEPLSNNVMKELEASDRKHRNQSSTKSLRYSQPTLASKLKEKLSEKPKKKEEIPFVPVGSQGKSYHVGVIIQKELGQLKSQPLEIWAAAKQSASKREAFDSSSSILHRELSKN